MKSSTENIEDWFALIRGGQITLPRFQRHEAWRPNQIEDVLENILQKPPLPIGTLLVLQVGDKELFHSRAISGAPEPQGKPQLNLLDGQQRMTALWRALTDDYEDITVFVSLSDEKYPAVEAVKRHWSNGKRNPLWADNPVKTLNKRGSFPISLLCPGADGEERKKDWIKTAEADGIVSGMISELRLRLAYYQITALSLPVDTKQETALDVFIKMNTSASPLQDYDIVVAQYEGAAGESLHEKINDLKEAVPSLGDYGKVEDAALAVGALLNGKPPLKKTYLEPTFAKELASVWDKVVYGLSRGVSFLRDESIFSGKLLPTEVIVYLTSALWANVPEDGVDKEGRARAQIRKAIWRASFTERYSKTATTRAFADYKAISELIEHQKTALPLDLFDESQYPLPDAEELSRSGWPALKDKLGRAIVAASLYGGGYDFADGAKATADNIGRREYHHLFPKSLLEDEPDYLVNSALNCALISWKTNRKIAAKNPKHYLEDRAKEAGATEKQVKQRLESHLVPYDELINNNFKDFITARAERVHAVMKTLCDGSVP